MIQRQSFFYTKFYLQKIQLLKPAYDTEQINTVANAWPYCTICSEQDKDEDLFSTFDRGSQCGGALIFSAITDGSQGERGF